MAVPKQHKTKSRRDQRRMHIFIKQPNLVVCPRCHKPMLPHTVCQNCGYYKGIQVIDVLKKLTKKEKKEKEKEINEGKKVKRGPLTMQGLSRSSEPSNRASRKQMRQKKV